MSLCIYCGKEEATSSEHILQDSLGSDWERKNILCATCNNLFGRTIDNTLADEFAFFRSFFSIPGKRKEIPNISLENEFGIMVTREGKTGAITTSQRPTITRHDNKDGTYTISATTQLAKSKKTQDDIKKGISRKKDTIVSSNFIEYTTQPVGQLHAKVKFSLPTFVALQKSLINYWCYLRRESDLQEIMSKAQKIHSFAKFCDEHKDNNARILFAKSIGINGYPLAIDISNNAKSILQGDLSLFHSIFLIPKNNELYGGLCLFNELHLGFKICDTTFPDNIPIFTTIDIEKRKNITITSETHTPKCNDFVFLNLNNSEFIKKFNEYISNSVQLCMFLDHQKSFNSIIDSERLKHSFPITDPKTIHNIYFEMVAIILGWIFLPKEIDPKYFKSDTGRAFVETIVKVATDQNGDTTPLTEETYNRFANFARTAAQEFHDSNIHLAFIQPTESQ